MQSILSKFREIQSQFEILNKLKRDLNMRSDTCNIASKKYIKTSC